jgi:hypothetical protein
VTRWPPGCLLGIQCFWLRVLLLSSFAGLLLDGDDRIFSFALRRCAHTWDISDGFISVVGALGGYGIMRFSVPPT